MFYAELKKKRLRRNEKSFYTLDDENLDRLFCINNELTLTPNPSNIVSFAAINYLYGLLGIEVDTFTAVPSGFIASYVNKENSELYGTLFLSDTLYVTNDLITLYESKINQEDNKEVYSYILDILKNNETSLLEKSLLVSSYIKNNNVQIFDNNILSSDQKYDAVNQKNCSDNHKILKDIIIETIGTNPVKNQKYKEIMNEFILPGYLQYRGYDRDKNPIEQKGQILNEFDRLIILIEMLEYDKLPYPELRSKLSNIINILNMCSTDYSADMVYNLFKEIIDAKKVVTLDNVEEIASSMIESIIPPAPDNDNYKKETRDNFKR